MREIRQTGSRGFSLVEVSIALGIAAFCLVVIVGLLPAGLKAVKTSREEIAAAHCLEQIAGAIHGAQPATNAPGVFRALGSYSNISWSVGGAPVSVLLPDLSLAGSPAAHPPDRRLSAYVKVFPPTNATSVGQALVSVGWPASATWDEAQTNWSRVEGALSTRLIFLPTR